MELSLESLVSTTSGPKLIMHTGNLYAICMGKVAVWRNFGREITMQKYRICPLFMIFAYISKGWGSEKGLLLRL